MKTILKPLIAILITTLCYSQKVEKEAYLAFSTSIDIRNAIIGSKPTGNKPAIDLLYQFAMVGQNLEVNIGYESFNKIHFDKYTIGVGYHFPLYGRIGNTVIKTVLIPSIEPTIIDRWGKEWQTTSSHLSIGGNVALRWKLNQNLGIELLTNALPRTDLSAHYPTINKNIPIVVSEHFKIIYIL
jgi:hypothetical protein